MLRRLTFIIFLCTTVTSCCCPRSQREAQFIVDNFSRNLREKHNFLRCGGGGARYSRDCFRDITLHYYGFMTLDVPQARQIAVEAVEELLHEFNRNPVAHPEGLAFPITTEDIDITFEFDTFFGEFVNTRMIQYINVTNGYIYYYSFNCEVECGSCKVVREPYDRAYRVVQRNIEQKAESDEANKYERRKVRQSSDYDEEWGIRL